MNPPSIFPCLLITNILALSVEGMFYYLFVHMAWLVYPDLNTHDVVQQTLPLIPFLALCQMLIFAGAMLQEATKDPDDQKEERPP